MAASTYEPRAASAALAAAAAAGEPAELVAAFAAPEPAAPPDVGGEAAGIRHRILLEDGLQGRGEVVGSGQGRVPAGAGTFE